MDRLNKTYMKQLLIIFVESLGQLAAYFFHKKIFTVLLAIRNRFYTGYIRKRFGKFGNSVIMYKPYTLIGCEYIEIGDDNILECDLQLSARKCGYQTPKLSIGNNCLIRKGTHITAINCIEIGNNLMTGTNVLITDNSHGDSTPQTLTIPTGKRSIVSKGAVKIGDNVWIGNNVCILPGVTIGSGVIIGANSVVTHDVPNFSVVAGIPAKLIKTHTLKA